MPLSRYEKQYLWAGLWYLEVQKDGSVKVKESVVNNCTKARG